MRRLAVLEEGSGTASTSRGKRQAGERNWLNVVVYAVILLTFGLVSTTYAQQAVSSPRPVPYIHTVVAGSPGSAAWTPAAVAGTTTAPAVHGSAPGDSLPATDATVQFNGPTALAIDGLGNLYITDSNGWVRRVGPDGVIKTFAGGLAKATAAGITTCPGGTNVVGDGCPANEIYVKSVQGIAIDPKTGDIYLSDSGDYRIRKIDHATYKVTTIAGTGTKGNTDGDLAICSSITGATCSGTVAPLYSPRGMAIDRRGNLFIGEGGSTGSNGSLNYDVRVANFTTGKLTTIVNKTHTKACTIGMGITYGTTKAADLTMGIAKDLAFDAAGNLYIADASCAYVYKVEAHGPDAIVDETSLVSIVAGNGLTNPTDPTTNYQYQPATSATIPAGSVKADANGNLYIGESQTSSPAIPAAHVWFYDAATGYVHPIFGGATTGDCFGVPASGVAPYNGCDGMHSAPATANGTMVALDPWGNVYVADSNARFVHKLSLGTNAPFVATTPAGQFNAVLHFGAGDGLASLDTSSAASFTVAQGTCATNADNTQDCGATVASNASTDPVYQAFKVTSSLGNTSTVYLTNQTMPVCQPPLANNQTVELQGATANIIIAGQIGAGCSGAENPVVAPHALTYLFTKPSQGALSGTAPNLTYTPNDPNSTATDSFTYTVVDKAGVGPLKVSYDDGAFDVTMPTQKDLVSATGTVTIVPILIPAAQNQSVVVPFNTATRITLAATGNGTISYAVASSPANGTLSGTAPNLTYTPNTDFVGSDSFTFTATNQAGTSGAATISIEVHPASVPTALAQSVTVVFDTPTPITLKASGNGTITYAVVTEPSHGTLSGDAPNLTYTPTAGYVGTDSFTFKASNILGDSEAATVSITVNQAAPVADPQSVVVNFNTATSITLTATGNGTITYAVLTNPAHGTLSGTAPNLTYTPTPDYVGADSFTFKANNGTDSNVATVTIVVHPAAPTVQSDRVDVTYNTEKSFTLGATGTGPLTYSIVAAPTHGSLSGTAPNLKYTPNANYAGTDSFTFTASNAGGVSNVATISITVYADVTWTLPSGVSTSATVNAGETANYSLMVSGWNGATNSVTLTCSGAPVPCTVSPNPVTLNGTTAVPVAVSVQTAGPHSVAAASTGATWPGNGLPLSLTLTLAGIAALVVTARSSKLQWRMAGACAALLMVVSLTACGAGKQQGWNARTPSGNYILTVTATTHATTGDVSKSYTLTLNVK